MGTRNISGLSKIVWREPNILKVASESEGVKLTVEVWGIRDRLQVPNTPKMLTKYGIVTRLLYCSTQKELQRTGEIQENAGLLELEDSLFC